MSDPLTILGAIRRSFGIVISIVILTAMSYVTYGIDRWARLLVKLVELAAGAEIESDKIPFNGQRVFNKPVYESSDSSSGTGLFDGVIDEDKTLRATASSFSFGPEELIAKTKTLLSDEVAFGSKKPDVLAEDFQFIFPVVGPLNKTEFVTIFGGFKINDAFPNAANNYFGFTVDPLEPNRDKNNSHEINGLILTLYNGVWYFSRAELKHEGTLRFGKVEYPATHKKVVHTPQVFSFSFDNEGRVYKFTGGYPVDRTVGNAGGLGGLFGIVHAVGGALPLGPESKPWKPSLEWEAWAKRTGQLTKEWMKISQK